MFWDFGSLYLEALRRPSGRVLRQRHSVSLWTLRRPGCRLLRQRPTLLYQAQAAGSISLGSSSQFLFVHFFGTQCGLESVSCQRDKAAIVVCSTFLLAQSQAQGPRTLALTGSLSHGRKELSRCITAIVAIGFLYFASGPAPKVSHHRCGQRRCRRCADA